MRDERLSLFGGQLLKHAPAFHVRLPVLMVGGPYARDENAEYHEHGMARVAACAALAWEGVTGLRKNSHGDTPAQNSADRRRWPHTRAACTDRRRLGRGGALRNLRQSFGDPGGD